MSSKTTRVTAFEVICDICGKKETWTGIEGITPEGEKLATGWLTFNVVVSNFHGAGPDWVDVCSEKCFMEHCGRMYKTLRT